MLTLADNLKLPVDAVTQTFAILAKRGVGKTHTATVMAEEMLEIGQPIVVYDPTSAWWGLKSSKDGKRPGYPVVIFGGEHADVPLEENAGAMIATVIVEKRIPAVLDVGLLRKGARVRFMTDFCETLYHKNREALHFFCDEAHTIAPQNIRSMPEAARLLGAMEDIVLQGRRRGLGVTVISQRPALVNKNCTTQCEVLVAMQLTGSHDRKAIEEWVDVHGDDQTMAKEMLASLSSLQRGEAWVWSPGWLRKLVRTTFRDRRTFDSSATPKVGGRVITPKSVAEIDLAALGDQIKATVERAKADDPKELRRKIAELQKQLDKPAQTLPSPEAKAAAAKLVEHARQVGIVDGRGQAKREIILLAKQAFDELVGAIGELPAESTDSSSLVNRTAPILPKTTRELTGRGELLTKPVKQTSPPAPKRDLPLQSTYNGQPLSGPAKAVLQALYWLRDETADLAKVGFYARYHTRSKSFTNALGMLRSAGLVDGLKITLSGCDAIADIADEKPRGPELRRWLGQWLKGVEAKVLDALIEAGNNRVSIEALADVCGYHPRSKSFTNALGRLRTIEAAEGYDRDGGVKASDVFFE